MLKQWIKQVVPGRYRPFILKIIKLINAVADVPAIVRFHLADHKHIVAANLTRRDKRIVFVSEKPSWREAKLAFGLKRAGWDVVQLHRFKPVFDDFGDFAELQQFSSPWNAVELAHKAKAKLFHAFAPSCDDTCIELANNKPGRLIVDFYDNFFSISHGLPPLERKFALDVDKQERCIQQADAIVSRDLQLQYHRKFRAIGRGRPIICFPEYCWDQQPLPQIRSDGEIHVVQIGWMGFEVRGENDVGCYNIASAFVEAGCQFHIYLHPTFPAMGTALFKSLFQEYMALQAKTGRVHFHDTVSPQQIVAEIAHYDFGINMINGLSLDGIVWTHSNPRRSPYCGSSRLFDYLDAGLGFLVDSRLRYMRHTFGPYGVLFNGTALLRNGKICAKLPSKPPREQALKARAHLSVARNIGRLARFYDRLD